MCGKLIIMCTSLGLYTMVHMFRWVLWKTVKRSSCICYMILTTQ